MAFGDNVVFGNVRRTPTSGGGLTQATVGGINLQTGMPISNNVMTQTNLPQTSNVPIPSMGFAPRSTGVSNSDAFFNGPPTIARRVVSVTPNDQASNSVSFGRGNSTGGMSSILKQIMDSFTASRAANEGRYNEAKGEVAKLGKVREGEIEGQYKQDAARMEQQAISRGLGNSSIRESLLGGARKRQNEALTGLREAQAKTNIGLLQSREDDNINPMQLVQLIQQAAQYGGSNQLASIAKAMGLA